jgi:hypothetical protein
MQQQQSTFCAVELKGFVRGELVAFGNQFKPPRQFLRLIKDYRKQVFKTKINGELNWDWTPTKSLTPAYKRRKDQTHPGRKIRVKTGAFVRGHKVIDFANQVVETLDDAKSEWIVALRPILPPDGEDIPPIEQAEIIAIGTKFLNYIKF